MKKKTSNSSKKNLIEVEYCKYKVTLWINKKVLIGYRYLPKGKATAMMYLRDFVEMLPDFYHVLGYKIETETDLGYDIPDKECKYMNPTTY